MTLPASIWHHRAARAGPPTAETRMQRHDPGRRRPQRPDWHSDPNSGTAQMRGKRRCVGLPRCVGLQRVRGSRRRSLRGRGGPSECVDLTRCVGPGDEEVCQNKEYIDLAQFCSVGRGVFKTSNVRVALQSSLFSLKKLAVPIDVPGTHFEHYQAEFTSESVNVQLHN